MAKFVLERIGNTGFTVVEGLNLTNVDDDKNSKMKLLFSSFEITQINYKKVFH